MAEAKVDPSYDVLLGSIEQANTFYDKEALATNWQADIGTTLVLITVALLLTGFLLRFKQVQRTLVMQEATQQREAYITALIGNVSDVLIVLDTMGVVRFVSPAVETVLGYSPSHLQNRPLRPLIHEENVDTFQTGLLHCQTEKARIQQELRLQNAQGVWRNAEMIAINLLDNADIAGILVTLRDITERKGFEDQIAYQAYHDALTDLPNRAFLIQRLKTALACAEGQGSQVGVIFVDLDNSK